MGKKFSIKNGQSLGEPEKIRTGGTGGTGGQAATGAGAASTGTGGTGGTGTGGKTEKEKSPVVAMVTADEKTEKPVQKPETKKPKKVRQRKKQEPTLPAEQVDALIVGMSGIIASRPNCAHWLISESEAHSISVPLCNILEKSGVLSSVGENSDAIALAMAAITIVVPRAIMSAAIIKEGKTHARTGNKTDVAVKEGTAKGSNGKIPERDNREPKRADDVPGNGSDLSFLGDFVG